MACTRVSTSAVMARAAVAPSRAVSTRSLPVSLMLWAGLDLGVGSSGQTPTLTLLGFCPPHWASGHRKTTSREPRERQALEGHWRGWELGPRGRVCTGCPTTFVKPHACPSSPLSWQPALQTLPRPPPPTLWPLLGPPPPGLSQAVLLSGPEVRPTQKGTGDLHPDGRMRSLCLRKRVSTTGPEGQLAETWFVWETQPQLLQSELKGFIPAPDTTPHPPTSSLADLEGRASAAAHQGHPEPRASWHRCPREPDLTVGSTLGSP